MRLTTYIRISSINSTLHEHFYFYLRCLLNGCFCPMSLLLQFQVSAWTRRGRMLRFKNEWAGKDWIGKKSVVRIIKWSWILKGFYRYCEFVLIIKIVLVLFCIVVKDEASFGVITRMVLVREGFTYGMKYCTWHVEEPVCSNIKSRRKKGAVKRKMSDKPKPCCVCLGEKDQRDQCILFNGQDSGKCREFVNKYKKCMQGYGFQIWGIVCYVVVCIYYKNDFCYRYWLRGICHYKRLTMVHVGRVMCS